MSAILAGVLLVISIAGTAVVALAAPLLIAVMLYEIVRTEESAPIAAEATPMRIAAKRGIARAFVLGGGVFWSLASFAGLYSFRETGFTYAVLGAFFPLLACVATLVVGWYFERVTAALLVLASFGVIAWGIVYQFEAGVWVLMTLALIGPMMTAAVLFWLARRDQEAFETEFSLRPELSVFFSARSKLAPVTAN